MTTTLTTAARLLKVYQHHILIELLLGRIQQSPLFRVKFTVTSSKVTNS
jgi:hypothetical protein